MWPKLKKKMNTLTANELRIGNLVTYLGKIVSCDTNTIHAISKVVQPSALYQPIPLTDIWPEKLGFKKVKFDYVIPISPCGVCSLTLIPQDDLCSTFSVMVSQSDDNDPDENVFLEAISFVHELQNLFFGITKKELTIND